MSERYVVKLANGAWLTELGTQTRALREAQKGSRADAYRVAASWSAYGAVALRLRPSARAAELAKLRGEVTELERKLDAMTDTMRDDLVSLLTTYWPEETVCASQSARVAKERDALREVVDAARDYAWCDCKVCSQGESEGLTLLRHALAKLDEVKP